MDFYDFGNTNNIYKFIAFIGLLLFISPTFLFKEKMQLELEVANIKMEQEIIKNKLGVLMENINMVRDSMSDVNLKLDAENRSLISIRSEVEKIKKIEEEIDLIVNKNNLDKQDISNYIKNYKNNIGKKIDLSNQSFEDLLIELENIESDLERNKVMHEEIISLLIEENYKIDTLEIKENYLNDLKRLTFISRFFGITLLIIGAVLWYLFFQVYQDKYIMTWYRRNHRKFFLNRKNR